MEQRAQPEYWIRQRSFRVADASSRDACAKVCAILNSTEGVEHANFADPHLDCRYDIRFISCPSIIATLYEHEISLERTKVQMLLDIIWNYREMVRRKEQSIEYGWDAWIREIYVSRYKHRRHGRRDDRLTNWRNYLEPREELAVEHQQQSNNT